MRKNTEKAHLGFALMWREGEDPSSAEKVLQESFCQFIKQSDIFVPPFASYYFKEMGSPLVKKFVLTDCIIDKSDIKNVKHKAMEIENRFRKDGNRTVNIDPFYIDMEQLVVATSKYRGNRIYIGEGVYVELELFYHHRSFQPFIWTYRDYQEHIPFFNSLRKVLKL
ncbi:DUF4416 family protein [Persephonella sp.]